MAHSTMIGTAGWGNARPLRRWLALAAFVLLAAMADLPDAAAEAAPQTGLVFRQHGEPVPFDSDGELAVSLDRAPFEILFPRALMAAAGLDPASMTANILVSTDPQLFGYIRRPHFRDRIGPAHAYAIPPATEHHLMLTDVDPDTLMTAHNAMFGYRFDLQEADAFGLSVDTIVGRDMTDRLPAAPAELFLVVVILLEPPAREEIDPDAGPDALTPALVDYVVLKFPG